MTDDIISRLREHGEMFPIENASEWIDFASLYLVQAADDIERLRALLKPFADLASFYDSPYKSLRPSFDGDPIYAVETQQTGPLMIMVGMLRKARAALTVEKKDER